jgi:hypothetical protein
MYQPFQARAGNFESINERRDPNLTARKRLLAMGLTPKQIREYQNYLQRLILPVDKITPPMKIPSIRFLPV